VGGVRGFSTVCILAAAFSAAAPAAEFASGHVVESFVPALAFNHDCQSHVMLTNLGDAAVKVEVEGHASGGGLVPLLGRRNRTWINPGESLEYTPEITSETDGAWFRIREHVPSPGDPAVVAVRASVGCLSGNILVNTAREVAFPMRNPWFAGSALEWTGVELWAVNVSPHPARAHTCYSNGTYYILPEESGPSRIPPQPQPVCSHSDDVQMAPWASYRFPLERDGSTQFSLRTEGEAILLQALRPAPAGSNTFAVESRIIFHAGEQ
jgi:hypothetical protein